MALEGPDMSAAVAAAAGSPAPAAPAAPAPSAPASQPPPSRTPPAAAAPSQPAGGGAGAAAPTQTDWSLRQELGSLGITGEFADDRAAFQAMRTQLAQQQAQMQQAARAGHYYLTNREQIEAAVAAHRQQQAAAAAPAAPTAPVNPWNPPEWNPQWERFLERDPTTGRIVAVPGADPSLPQKYEQYTAWQRDTFNKLLTNPMETLQPLLDPYVSKRIEEAVEQRLAGFTSSNQAERELAANEQWLFARDNAGMVLVDPISGQRQLSEAGQEYSRVAQELESQGIRDVGVTARLAKQAAENFMLRKVLEAAQANGGTLPAIAPAGAPAAPGTPAPGANGAAAANAALKNRALGGASHIAAGGAAGAIGVPNPADQKPKGPPTIHTLKQKLNEKLAGIPIKM